MAALDYFKNQVIMLKGSRTAMYIYQHFPGRHRNSALSEGDVSGGRRGGEKDWMRGEEEGTI